MIARLCYNGKKEFYDGRSIPSAAETAFVPPGTTGIAPRIFCPPRLHFGDANGDNAVSAADLLLLRRYLASLKVLFLGNSLTYYNDMPYIFRDLAAAAGSQLEATYAASATVASQLRSLVPLAFAITE